MSFQWLHLDERTRTLMLDEMERDLACGNLYLSKRLTQEGQEAYPGLLREAIMAGDKESLASCLRTPNLFAATEYKQKPSGGYAVARVPANAPDMFAEGEFNRFYIRALCRRALEEGASEVEVYRAKQVGNPRPESQALIGKHVDALDLLNDLRTHPGVDTALHLPPGPNSGLSVRLI